MNFQNEPLKQIIRYEQSLKSIYQQLDILILEAKPAHLPAIRQLIHEQDQLIKYLEVETSRLNSHSKQIYMKNLTRFKNKLKQHREYVTVFHGRAAMAANPAEAQLLELQGQNLQLANQKMMMYDNQRIQDGMGRQVFEQGQVLYSNIGRNKDIQRQTYQAESTIGLIQLSIFKRKFMFISLCVLFVLALITSIVVKVNRKK